MGMTRPEFWEFAQDLAIYYGSEKLSTPTSTGKAQLQSWYEQIQNMPAEPLPWIANRIKQSYDIMPKNLPKLMWALWFEWRDAHPEKRANRTDPANCDCDGGVIMVWLSDSKGWVGVRCLNCMPALPDTFELADLGGSRKHGVWQSTREELLREGWQVRTPRKRPEGTPQQALDMAKQGKRIEVDLTK